LAEGHISAIEGENAQRAAIALRMAYHHGIETLFSLLGASVQAPGAVVAWLARCSNKDLRELVGSLISGRSLLTPAGPKTVGLEELGRAVHSHCWTDEMPPAATGERFGRFWQRLAREFLNEDHVDEYNSLKHGLRISAGGVTIAMCEERERGVRPPPEQMHVIGGSEFGSGFFRVEPVSADKRERHHLQIRRRTLNWSPCGVGQRLLLIAWSINNIAAFLRCVNGVAPDTVKFVRPEDPAVFEACWHSDVGVLSSSFDLIVERSQIEAAEKGKLRKELEARGREQGPSARECCSKT